MKLYLDNVAKVKNAEIEINGITVIAGYNGSGKSTVCKALYSICSAFENLSEKVEDSRRSSIYNCLEEWDAKRHIDDPDFYWSDLPDHFFDMVHNMDIFLQDITIEQLAEITETKSKDRENLEQLYDSLKKIIDRPFVEYAHFVIERIFFGNFNGQINSLSNNKNAHIRLEGTDFEKIELIILKNRLFQSTTKPVKIGNPVYIETSSCLDTVAAQRQRRAAAGKIPANALFASKDDMIMTIEKYHELEEAHKICSQIMNEVTHGELVAKNRELSYKENNLRENIACGNIASGLKNILLIQTMLYNGFLNSNSLLLIDEPEVNLHPEWQVKFAEILVLLYKRLGIKVVLNTHSPYFMRAIESKMADNSLADKAKYYFMVKASGTENAYLSEDVTGNTERVYQTMYRPLENL